MVKLKYYMRKAVRPRELAEKRAIEAPSDGTMGNVTRFHIFRVGARFTTEITFLEEVRSYQTKFFRNTSTVLVTVRILICHQFGSIPIRAVRRMWNTTLELFVELGSTPQHHGFC